MNFISILHNGINHLKSLVGTPHTCENKNVFLKCFDRGVEVVESISYRNVCRRQPSRLTTGEGPF